MPVLPMSAPAVPGHTYSPGYVSAGIPTTDQMFGLSASSPLPDRVEAVTRAVRRIVRPKLRGMARDAARSGTVHPLQPEQRARGGAVAAHCRRFPITAAAISYGFDELRPAAFAAATVADRGWLAIAGRVPALASQCVDGRFRFARPAGRLRRWMGS
jgi:hypothetical protein